MMNKPAADTPAQVGWLPRMHSNLGRVEDTLIGTRDRLSATGFFPKPADAAGTSGAEAPSPDNLRGTVQDQIDRITYLVSQIEQQVESLA